MFVYLFLTFAVLSVLLNLWQWYAGTRFSFDGGTRTLFSPPVSILRPLKGCDLETERCLESWFVLHYQAEFELLFGAASPEDPVCDVVRRLMKRHANTRAELVICDPVQGANAKVSSLCYLARRARHEHIIVSDQDVRVPVNFLSRFLEELRDEKVGLVNSLYILRHPKGIGMWLEAVAVNADFWTQVLQGNMLKRMDFALGAAMGTRQRDLQQIGGFEALRDYLADDYQLGNRIAQGGRRVVISSVPVECLSEPHGLKAVWKHQLRWARTVRVCQPLPYFLSVLNNATFWPALFWAWDRSFGGAVVFLAAIFVRTVTSTANYRRFTHEPAWKAGLLAPVKDLMQMPIWALAFTGKAVVWRGQRFHVDRGGKLTPLA